MVKTVLSVAHIGLRDWKIQRLTAIIMTIYVFFLLGYLISHPGLSFAQWHSLFANPAMQVATILFVSSILYHTWIGMWTVFTDYVKCTVLRTLLEALMLIMLLACLVWAFLILWSL